MSEQEQVVIKYNKVSMWMMFKIAMFLWAMHYAFDILSVGDVASDIALAKAFGFIETAYETVCRYCGN